MISDSQSPNNEQLTYLNPFLYGKGASSSTARPSVQRVNRGFESRRSLEATDSRI